MLQRYDNLIKKYKISPERNLESKLVPSNGQSPRNRTVNKKGVTEVNKSPETTLKNNSSHVVYNQFDTFDHHSELSNGIGHNLSVETLQNLKSKRSNRRFLFREKSEKGRNDLTPDVADKIQFRLPDPNKRNKYSNNMDENHIKSQSIESKSVVTGLI